MREVTGTVVENERGTEVELTVNCDADDLFFVMTSIATNLVESNYLSIELLITALEEILKQKGVEKMRETAMDVEEALPIIKEAYQKALDENSEVFIIGGEEISTQYAKYMIEFMEAKQRG